MAASMAVVTGVVYLQIISGIYLFVTWCFFRLSDVVIAKLGAGEWRDGRTESEVHAKKDDRRWP